MPRGALQGLRPRILRVGADYARGLYTAQGLQESGNYPDLSFEEETSVGACA